jgi:hypothetical protein
LPYHFFTDEGVKAKVAVAVHESAFFKGKLLASIYQDTLTALATCGVSVGFRFDEELRQFHLVFFSIAEFDRKFSAVFSILLMCS